MGYTYQKGDRVQTGRGPGTVEKHVNEYNVLVRVDGEWDPLYFSPDTISLTEEKVMSTKVLKDDAFSVEILEAVTKLARQYGEAMKEFNASAKSHILESRITLVSPTGEKADFVVDITDEYTFVTFPKGQ